MKTDFKTPKRFWSKVDIGEVDKCWEWLASKPSGYGQFKINHKYWPAHRVVWKLTFGSIPERLQVCHHCDNPGCCNPYHLFLGTNRDNHLDAAKKGRKARGEGNGNSKLTEEEVLEIRELYAAGKGTQQGLADKFGVTNPTVNYIVNGKTWAWL